MCELCGVKPEMTFEITWKPDEVTFGCFVPNDHGSPYIDKETGKAVTTTITKRIFS